MSAKIVLVAIGLVAINVVTTAPSGCPAVDGPNSVYFPDEDCTVFWQCSNGKPYKFDCPANLHFNPKLNVCDWPQHAGCDSSDDSSSDSSSSSEENTPAPPPPTSAPSKSSEEDDSSSSSSSSSSESSENDATSNNCENSKCPAVDGANSVYFPLKDCTKFCQCSNGAAYRHDCPAGLHFNPVKNVCDWPLNAGCKGDK